MAEVAQGKATSWVCISDGEGLLPLLMSIRMGT